MAPNKNVSICIKGIFLSTVWGKINVFRISQKGNSQQGLKAVFQNKIRIRITHYPFSTFCPHWRVTNNFLQHFWQRPCRRHDLHAAQHRCSIRSQAPRWPSVTASKACCRSSVVQLSHPYGAFSKHYTGYVLLHTSMCVAITLRCQTSIHLKARNSCRVDAFSLG